VARWVCTTPVTSSSSSATVSNSSPTPPRSTTGRTSARWRRRVAIGSWASLGEASLSMEEYAKGVTENCVRLVEALDAVLPELAR